MGPWAFFYGLLFPMRNKACVPILGHFGEMGLRGNHVDCGRGL